MNSDAICGTSDFRNLEYQKSFNTKLLYNEIFGVNYSPLILDIGAHKGESISYFSHIFCNPIIHSFEPDPDSYIYLTNNFSNHPSVSSINNLALSNNSGISKFYRQQLSHLGGLSKVNMLSKDSLGFAKTASNNELSVTTTTIDEFSKHHNLERIDLVKIDVQGYEYEVLEGANNSLKTIKCLAIEICLFDFYEKKSDVSSIFQILYGHGYSLYAIPKISQNPQNFRSDWFEAIFIK